MTGKFHPANEKRMGAAFGAREADLERICDTIKRQKVPQICINDSEDILDYQRCFTALADAFAAILPEKSSFEKQ